MTVVCHVFCVVCWFLRVVVALSVGCRVLCFVISVWCLLCLVCVLVCFDCCMLAVVRLLLFVACC